jgi:hypothetical protein
LETSPPVNLAMEPLAAPASQKADRSGVMTDTVVVGNDRPLPEPTEVMSRAANAKKS